VALTLMNLCGFRYRLGSFLVIAIGISCVVCVLVSMLSMGRGLREVVTKSVRADRAVVISRGAYSSFRSDFTRETARTVIDMPGIRKDANGASIATASTIVLAAAQRRSDNVRVSVPLLGVDQQFVRVFPEVRLTAGRMFHEGLYELIAGKSRHTQVRGLGVGDRIHLSGADWTVVGHFEAGGSTTEGVLIGDVNTVTAAFNRETTQTVTVVLDSQTAFESFRAALAASPSLNVELVREAELTKQEFSATTRFLDFVSYFVGTVMALGATLGAMNVMYALSDSRQRELATLRAIGFRAGPIVVALLAEAVLYALPGALVGVLLAWLVFDGDAVNPMGISMQLAVTAELAVVGVGWALMIGLLGGILPALRVVRVHLSTALRAL
jgi:putative ABC transport system permease protein